jgi:NH3-dependent NAD+ synthetase
MEEWQTSKDIVIGLIAPIGTNVKSIEDAVENFCESNKIQFSTIKLSDAFNLYEDNEIILDKVKKNSNNKI